MLRVATRAAHDRVDALFSRFDLSDPADYRAFLTAQAAAFLPVEQALDASDAAALFPDWPQRRRANLLRADLAELGADVPDPLSQPRFASPAEIAGAAYVLEGSRLGGAMLAKSVPPGMPRRFLAAPSRGGQWRDFLARLEQVVESRVQKEQAVTGATQVFEHFAQAARPFMETR